MKVENISSTINLVLQLVTVFAVIFGFYWLYKNIIKPLFSPESPLITYNRANLRYTEEELQSVADVFENAMADMGTDEELIFDTLNESEPTKQFNKDELLCIWNKFGVRRNFPNPVANNLYEWFKSDLNDSEFQRVKTLFKPSGMSWTL